MAYIIGIGIATLDVINHTDGYPQEDDEVRAIRQTVRRGGNVTNTLTVLSQLGHQCEWAGTLADDSNSHAIKTELHRYQIASHRCTVHPHGHAPTSYITLNENNGSRTIVHYRNLPEYSFDDFMRNFYSEAQPNPFEKVDWLHVEGRNILDTVKILDFVANRNPQLKISIEVEKPREHLEKLYAYGDIVFFSRHFANNMRYPEAQFFLQDWRNKCRAAVLVCPWGASGAFAVDHDGVFYQANAVQISRAVDTIGAGDTFVAGFIHAKLAGLPLQGCLRYANALAGKKCSQPGFDNLAENMSIDSILQPELRL